MQNNLEQNNRFLIGKTQSVLWWPLSMISNYLTANSQMILAKLERKLLNHIWHSIDEKFVELSDNNEIRTISLNNSSKETPLVMVHGMGAGVGMWSLNLHVLSRARPVHAFDVLGFGRSSRPDFSRDAMVAEAQLIESIEEWRQKMEIEKMILLGHSLGGFLTASYAIRYPERVEHLIIVDGWGFAARPNNTTERTPIPKWIKLIGTILSPFNPFAGIRMLGPIGKGLIRNFRSDLITKFRPVTGDEPTAISDYIYYCNTQKPSGETAFKSMSIPFGWARNPMIDRIDKLDEKVPMTMIYGSRSWVDSASGWEVKRRRNLKMGENDLSTGLNFVDVHLIKGAGHHVYADRFEEFNTLVNKIAANRDARKIRQRMSKLSIRKTDSFDSANHIQVNAYNINQLEPSLEKMNSDLNEIKLAAKLDDTQNVHFELGDEGDGFN